jgi:hypothetical protein
MRKELDQLYEQVYYSYNMRSYRNVILIITKLFAGFHSQFRTEEKLAKDYKDQNAQYQLVSPATQCTTASVMSLMYVFSRLQEIFSVSSAVKVI